MVGQFVKKCYVAQKFGTLIVRTCKGFNAHFNKDKMNKGITKMQLPENFKVGNVVNAYQSNIRKKQAHFIWLF